MKALIQYTTVIFLLLTSACATGEGHQAYNGNWDTMKYSDFAAVEPSGFLRMGK